MSRFWPKIKSALKKCKKSVTDKEIEQHERSDFSFNSDYKFNFFGKLNQQTLLSLHQSQGFSSWNLLQRVCGVSGIDGFCLLFLVEASSSWLLPELCWRPGNSRQALLSLTMLGLRKDPHPTQLPFPAPTFVEKQTLINEWMCSWGKGVDHQINSMLKIAVGVLMCSWSSLPFLQNRTKP